MRRVACLAASIAQCDRGTLDINSLTPHDRARQLGVHGIALFSYDALATRTGYARSLRTLAFPGPAERKPMK